MKYLVMLCDGMADYESEVLAQVTCDENGNSLDGDDLLLLLSKENSSPCIVGTSMTNKGLENFIFIFRLWWYGFRF